MGAGGMGGLGGVSRDCMSSAYPISYRGGGGEGGRGGGQNINVVIYIQLPHSTVIRTEPVNLKL